MQLRAGRGRNLSASLNMDKLNYFFQPLVQSFPLFPIIPSLKEVAWAMIEEEKNHPSLLSLSLSLKKSDLEFQMNSGM